MSYSSSQFSIILIITLSYIPSIIPQFSTSDDNIPSLAFAFGWLNDNDTFVAGDVATIKVIVLGNYDDRKTNHSFNPNVSVNNKMGNTSLVSGVTYNFGGHVSTWTITFVPIMVGLLNVLIVDDNFHVFDSSLHFHVNPGRLYPSAGVVSWKGQMNEFVAGALATILILPKDAFGNNVTASSEGINVTTFDLSVSFMNGSIASPFNVTNKGWNEYGYIQIEFVPVTAGSLFLNVEAANQTLIGSPLMFKVTPGVLDVPSCVPQWKAATKFFQLFSTMETHIHQRDKYGNLVSGLYSFDIEVIEKGTNLSMPVADLRFSEVVPGIQLCSFSLAEPGNFTLLITDREQINLISQVSYDFTVYVARGDDPLAITMDSMQKGHCWINRNSIGRYWASFITPLGKPSQSEYHIPRAFLKPKNLVVVLEEAGGIPHNITILTTVNRDTICTLLSEVKLCRYWKVCKQLQGERTDSRSLARCIQELRMKGASFDLSKEPMNAKSEEFEC